MRTIAIATYNHQLRSDRPLRVIKKANCFGPQDRLIDIYQWTQEDQGKAELGDLVNLELIMEF